LAGIAGAVGQANYAAANVFLDALAHYRRSLGLHGLSIAWGPWAEGGMAAGLGDREQAAMAKRGLDPMAPDQGLKILGRLIREDATHAMAARVNGTKFTERLYGEGPRRFFKIFAKATAAPGQDVPDVSTGAAKGLPRRLAETLPGRRRSVLMAHIRSRITDTLGLNPSEYFIEPRERLLDLGIDSIMAVELKERLETDLVRALPATLVFDYATIEGLTDYLLGDAPTPAISEASEPTPPRDDDLATFFSEVDGMSEDAVRDKFLNR
jgi:acyl carrier protein